MTFLFEFLKENKFNLYISLNPLFKKNYIELHFFQNKAI